MSITATDVTKNVVTPIGTAYYRLPHEVKNFLQLCHKKHGIVGFKWDEKDPWNFGVLLDHEENKV